MGRARCSAYSRHPRNGGGCFPPLSRRRQSLVCHLREALVLSLLEAPVLRSPGSGLLSPCHPRPKRLHVSIPVLPPSLGAACSTHQPAEPGRWQTLNECLLNGWMDVSRPGPPRWQVAEQMARGSCRVWQRSVDTTAALQERGCWAQYFRDPLQTECFVMP